MQEEDGAPSVSGEGDVVAVAGGVTDGEAVAEAIGHLPVREADELADDLAPF